MKQIGEQRGWGKPLANGRIEGISHCPLSLQEALRTLDVEELAVFFVLFPDRLQAWRRKVFEAHNKLVEEYRAKVQQYHADKKAQKKGGGPVPTAAFVDWEAGVADEDDEDEVLCRSISGDSERATLIAERAALTADLTEMRQRVVALTAQLEQATGSSDGGPAPQLSSMSPRISADQRSSLRRLIADDIGDGVTEDGIMERASDLGLAGLLE